MKITRFEDIKAWQKARELSQAFIRVTSTSRAFKNKSLLNQLGDCSDSAMANIVEGYDAGSDKEFLRFLQIAYRSLSEFQSHLYFALDAGCLNQWEFDRLYPLAKDAKGLNGGFQRYLKKCIKEGRPGIDRRSPTQDSGRATQDPGLSP